MPILVGIPSMMNCDIRELTLISEILILILERKNQIWLSYLRAAEESLSVLVWRIMVFLAVASVNMIWNCPASTSLMRRRIWLCKVLVAIVSLVLMTSARWTRVMVELKRGAIFALFFFFVTLWNGVSAGTAAASVYHSLSLGGFCFCCC